MNEELIYVRLKKFGAYKMNLPTLILLNAHVLFPHGAHCVSASKSFGLPFVADADG